MGLKQLILYFVKRDTLPFLFAIFKAKEMFFHFKKIQKQDNSLPKNVLVQQESW